MVSFLVLENPLRPLRWGRMSTLTQHLIEEIKTAPESVQREVFDVLAFLKTREKAEGRENLLPLAGTAWAAEWDTPEEDKAWRDL